MKLRLPFLFLLLLDFFVAASQVEIGEWQSHLPYSQAFCVTEAGERIYCATRGGLFYYDKSDNTLNIFTRVEGLSDVEISCINYSEDNGILLIAYSNANVDLVEGNSIYNVPDIKRKPLTANKTINNILFIGPMAYLSCGFGIVVINLEKKEIKDTYLIGENSTYKFVYDLASDGNFFYAATETGIYRADMNNPNLIDFNYWHRMTDVPYYDNAYNYITFFSGYLYANYLVESGGKVDTIYRYDGSDWSEFNGLHMNKTKSMEVYHGRLVVATRWHTDLYDENGKDIGNFSTDRPMHSILDKENIVWVADEDEGLISRSSSGEEKYFIPNGPVSSRSVALFFSNGKLYSAAGGDARNWKALYRYAEVSSLENGFWTGWRDGGYKDLIDIVEDPTNPDRQYAATWGYGVLEITNQEITNVYDDQNSTIQNTLQSGPYIRIGGLAFDNGNNLWVTNTEVPEPISVKEPDGKWTSFAFRRILGNLTLGRVIVTSQDHKWVQCPAGHGLFAFNVNGTINDESDDEFLKFDVRDVNGKIITNNVYCMAEEKNGNIWVGTDKGVVVYYNAYRVFDTDQFYAQQIIVPRNDGSGLADILLGTEIVTSITIDGANRKWIGTAKSGVFLLSEDGIDQIHNFTSENSPLLSNNIMDIAIDGKSGEVYIATDKGIISYRSTATDANENFTDVYVYPNPVREDYSGDIVITGMIEEASIKITDISGNLVYETTSLGGQAIWDGRSFSGEKVHTGVYLIFCTNEDGSKTYITKLLVIN
jgi:hypothetical protein